jgi:hypothetical protein
MGCLIFSLTVISGHYPNGIDQGYRGLKKACQVDDTLMDILMQRICAAADCSDPVFHSDGQPGQ